MRLLYVAPLKDFSGYANAARDYVRALDLAGMDLVTRPLHYDGGNYVGSEREQELFKKSLQGIDGVLWHTTPNEMSFRPDIFNCGYFAWETDRIPDEWVGPLNKLNLVMVPCDDNIKAARLAGVTVPIEKIPHTFDIKKYNEKVQPFEIPGGENHFKFLSICQMSRKKGVETLLRSYLAEFKPEDKTLLILKVYIGPNDGDNERNVVIDLINKLKEGLRLQAYPQIILIHQVTDDETIKRLYSTSDCYVLPSRGEGWSITVFDALAYGLPAITTGWGGQREYMKEDCGWFINYDMAPVFGMNSPLPYMYTAREKWAEPNLVHLSHCMREAYENWKIEKDGGGMFRQWTHMKKKAKESVLPFDYSIVGPHMKEVIISHYSDWKKQRGA